MQLGDTLGACCYIQGILHLAGLQLFREPTQVPATAIAAVGREVDSLRTNQSGVQSRTTPGLVNRFVGGLSSTQPLCDLSDSTLHPAPTLEVEMVCTPNLVM